MREQTRMQKIAANLFIARLLRLDYRVSKPRPALGVKLDF